MLWQEGQESQYHCENTPGWFGDGARGVATRPARPFLGPHLHRRLSQQAGGPEAVPRPLKRPERLAPCRERCPQWEPSLYVILGWTAAFPPRNCHHHLGGQSSLGSSWGRSGPHHTGSKTPGKLLIWVIYCFLILKIGSDGIPCRQPGPWKDRAGWLNSY